MKSYECLFIVENTVKDEDRAKLVDKFSKMAGKDVKVDVWGLKKFATPIDHKKDGYYYLMNFQSDETTPKTMADLMNITPGMVRYMFICKDDILKQKPVKAKKVKAEK